MGMMDESWCASCGVGMRYTEDENAECGKCEKETAVNFIESFIAYMTNHLAGLEETLTNQPESEGSQIDYLEGAIEATDHLLAKLVDRYQNA
jgi:hypothetical protein